MKKYKLSLSENEYVAPPTSYTSRILSYFKDTLIFYIVLILALCIFLTFWEAVLIFGFFILIHLVEYSNWARDFIIQILKEDKNLKIVYLRRNKEFTIEANIQKVSFQKKRIWYKVHGNADYLVIRFDEEVILKQYPIFKISPKILDQLIFHFSK